MNLQHDTYQIHKARLQNLSKETEANRLALAAKGSKPPAKSSKKFYTTILQILISAGR